MSAIFLDFKFRLLHFDFSFYAWGFFCHDMRLFNTSTFRFSVPICPDSSGIGMMPFVAASWRMFIPIFVSELLCRAGILNVFNHEEFKGL